MPSSCQVYDNKMLSQRTAACKTLLDPTGLPECPMASLCLHSNELVATTKGGTFLHQMNF
jgi:hypothetical protein